MDCAWCGTGEGICDEHMAAMFAQSEEIAASGQHLASTSEETQQQDTEPQPTK